MLGKNPELKNAYTPLEVAYYEFCDATTAVSILRQKISTESRKLIKRKTPKAKDNCRARIDSLNRELKFAINRVYIADCNLAYVDKENQSPVAKLSLNSTDYKIAV